MTPDDRPYCGAELLPHAKSPDGAAAPILCTREVHGRDSRHHSGERDIQWQWQDLDGSWLHDRPA